MGVGWPAMREVAGNTARTAVAAVVDFSRVPLLVVVDGLSVLRGWLSVSVEDDVDDGMVVDIVVLAAGWRDGLAIVRPRDWGVDGWLCRVFCLFTFASFFFLMIRLT